MTLTYEEYTTEFGSKFIKRTDEDGKIWWIPVDEANSDYQAYLNPVEHLTEIPIPNQLKEQANDQSL